MLERDTQTHATIVLLTKRPCAAIRGSYHGTRTSNTLKLFPPKFDRFLYDQLPLSTLIIMGLNGIIIIVGDFN